MQSNDFGSRGCAAAGSLQRFLTQRDSILGNTDMETAPRIFCINETGFGRHGFLSTGYSPRGQKLFVPKKKCGMTSVSVCACASVTGWVHYQKKMGSFNTSSFLEFLQNLKLPRGSTVILDNVSFHHTRAVKSFLQTAGVNVLFTPPYCPWFNPIEGCFSIVKRAFARTEDIDAAFQSLQPHHFAAFFRKSLSAVQRF